jgi:dTDP-4-amino-4,6-dideoxygalactose transaminase
MPSPRPRHQVNMSSAVLRAVAGAFAQRQLICGPHVAPFEARFADYIGVPNALGCSSGRDAFLLALQALELEPGDRVLVPDYTLAAVPALVVAMGLEPVFVDADPVSHQMDPEDLERAIDPRCKAVLATHLFGLASDMPRICAIAERHGLVVLEDCAQSCGGRIGGRALGSFGHLAFFSFNTGKNISCFGGGMLVGRDPELWARVQRLAAGWGRQDRGALAVRIARTLVTGAITSRRGFPLTLYPALRLAERLGSEQLDRLMVEEVAPPALPSHPALLADLQARVGLVQLGRLDAVNARTRSHAAILSAALEGLPGVRLPQPLAGAELAHFYLKVEVRDRAGLRQRLLRAGVDSNADDMFACSELEIFAPWARACPVSSRIHAHSLELPNGFHLREPEVRELAQRIRQAVLEG